VRGTNPVKFTVPKRILTRQLLYRKEELNPMAIGNTHYQSSAAMINFARVTRPDIVLNLADPPRYIKL
jgi:hypothetical protein